MDIMQHTALYVLLIALDKITDPGDFCHILYPIVGIDHRIRHLILPGIPESICQ